MICINVDKIKKRKSIKELLDFSIINIDKPSGPTSFLVSNFVKKKLGLRKTSHFGTLDPKTGGVLPVALNRACRLSTWLMRKDKTYVGIMRMHKEVEDSLLKEEMDKFVGRIKQIPPVKSKVRREERERSVKRFDVLERSDDRKDVLFLAETEAGTYIRKICSDLGEKIGGAHMLELRRIKAGLFDEAESYSLYDLENAVKEYEHGKDDRLRGMLIPGEIISRVMENVEIKQEAINVLFRGSPLFKKFLEKGANIKNDEPVAVFCKERFIEVARVTNQKDIFAVPEFVLS